ncbi:MAG TPA: acetyl-CoA C-acyltransferase, partial [Atribacteraceae bacterium]|nr:acetyl-CoA C-acyltransferase [Atribacteraceae bacterium]
SMGDTAELLAAEGGITREEMDLWSESSHRRATQALEKGFLSGEILPFKVTKPDGIETLIDRDESIRSDTTYEKLATLPPAFRKNGSITAGNSSPLNSGASMVLLMSEEKALLNGIRPLAHIVSFGWGGVDPLVMGKGPLPASRMALSQAGLTVNDIDYWEINEAFAVVPLWLIKKLSLDPEKVNINGGAIALGHPLGATGARLVGTLSRIMAEKSGTYGIATICIGGGQGLATLLRSY